MVFKATIDDANRIEPNLETIVPDNPNMPYDMKDVIKKIVDDGHFFEVHKNKVSKSRGINSATSTWSHNCTYLRNNT